MHDTPQIKRRTTIASGIVAVAAVAFACSAQSPRTSSQTALVDSAFAQWAARQGFQSWTAVRPVVGNTPPRYPDRLRADKVEGAVLAEFVVDTVGGVDPMSVRVLSATQPMFGDAVRAALSSMRFVPAEVNGRKVKQVAQIPFAFALADGASSTRVASAALDTAHRTVACAQGTTTCPVLRLQEVVTTALSR